MAIQHRFLTDPQIHEPKGVSSQSAGKVYVSNGTGSGVWTEPPITFTYRLDDLSDTTPNYLVFPCSGELLSLSAVLLDNVTDDAEVLVRNNTGGFLGQFTFITGSTAGDTQTIAPSTTTAFALEDKISFESLNLTNSGLRMNITVLCTGRIL